MGVWGAISGDLEPYWPSLSKIGVFLRKNEKSIFFIIWVWKWVEWPGLGKIIIVRPFRAHLVKCLLLKSAFFGFVLIFRAVPI